MIGIVKSILSNVLKAIYQPFLFGMILSFFVMFFVMYLEKNKGLDIKERIIRGVKEWKKLFVSSYRFRRLFYLVLFIAMVLFKTLLIRDLWTNPIANVIGTWGLHKENGDFTTEIVENIVLFIPLIFFLFFFLETTSKKTTKFLKVMGMAIAISFLSSLTIEMLQLFLRLGTWQLSDLAFNTLGGVIGGLIYWVSAKIRGK